MKGTVFALMAALALPAVADPLDTAQPLECVLAEAAQCDGAAQCESVENAQIDLPESMLIDFDKKTLKASTADRASAMDTLKAEESVILMSGNREGRGWVVVVDRATGHFTATITEQGGAFVFAGVCGVAP